MARIGASELKWFRPTVWVVSPSLRSRSSTATMKASCRVVAVLPTLRKISEFFMEHPPLDDGGRRGTARRRPAGEYTGPGPDMHQICRCFRVPARGDPAIGGATSHPG